MNIPPSTSINAPDFEKGLSGLQSALGNGGTFDPASGALEGVAKGNSILNFIRVAAYWLARGVVLPAEVVFRKQFGERYITAPVIFAFIAVIACGYVGDIFTTAGVYFLFGLVGVGLQIHSRQRNKAQRDGIHWHSYSEGESRLDYFNWQPGWNAKHGPFTTVSVAKNFGEPLVFLIGAVVFYRPSQWENLSLKHLNHPPPGTSLFVYFLVTGITMTLYQAYCAAARRGQLLDYLDAELMREALKESQKPNQPYAITAFKGAAYLPAVQPTNWSSPAPALSPIPAEPPAKEFPIPPPSPVEPELPPPVEVTLPQISPDPVSIASPVFPKTEPVLTPEREISTTTQRRKPHAKPKPKRKR